MMRPVASRAGAVADGYAASNGARNESPRDAVPLLAIERVLSRIEFESEYRRDSRQHFRLRATLPSHRKSHHRPAPADPEIRPAFLRCTQRWPSLRCANDPRQSGSAPDLARTASPRTLRGHPSHPGLTTGRALS